MSNVFSQGTLLGPNDLTFTTSDQDGAPVDPYAVSYTFYGKGSNRGYGSNGDDYLVGQAYRTAIRASQGVYYVGERISTGFLPGSYYVQWIIKRTPDTPLEIAGTTHFSIFR